MRSITSASRMAAMIFSSPPQFGQCSRSSAKTRLSSLAQLMHAGQRRHHQVRCAVAPGGLQLQRHLARGVALHPLVGQRQACDVAAQLFQRVVLVGAAAHGLGAVLDALKVVTAL